MIFLFLPVFSFFSKTAEVVFVTFADFLFLVSGAILTFAQFLKIDGSR